MLPMARIRQQDREPLRASFLKMTALKCRYIHACVYDLDPLAVNELNQSRCLPAITGWYAYGIRRCTLPHPALDWLAVSASLVA